MKINYQEIYKDFHECILGNADISAYGNIKMQRHPAKGLYIFNYTPEAQFSGTWNSHERVARGLVLDANGKVVAKALDKFFNVGEREESSVDYVGSLFESDEPRATEKLDGSLGIIFIHDGDIEVATRGSFVSEQALWTKNWLINHLVNQDKLDAFINSLGMWTLLVEIMYDDNEVVIKPNRNEISIITINVETRNINIPLQIQGRVFKPCGEAFRLGFAKKFNLSYARNVEFSNLEDILVKCKDLEGVEGFVLYFPSTQSYFKIKTDWYRSIHKLRFSYTDKALYELLRDQPEMVDDYLASLIVAPDKLERAKDMFHIISIAIEEAKNHTFNKFGEYVNMYHPEVINFSSVAEKINSDREERKRFALFCTQHPFSPEYTNKLIWDYIKSGAEFSNRELFFKVVTVKEGHVLLDGEPYLKIR